MKRKLLSWVAVLLVPALAWAQERPEQKADEKLEDYLGRVLGNAAVTEQAVSAAGTAAASTFADRVSNTLQNFLPLFQGVIDGIDTSEDNRTVTLRLNPVRAATFGELGLTASVNEPEPSEALLELLPEDARSTQKEAIQKTLDDFTDLTYAATYNYVRKLEREHLTDTSPRRWFFGRNPRLYEEIFASFAGEVLNDPQSNAALDPFFDRFPEGVRIENLTREELEAALGDDYDRFIDVMVARGQPLAALDAKVAKRAELFNQLVANQPQATLTASYHERDPLVGPNETGANLTIEMPAVPNINELLRSWRRAGGSWQQALDDLQAREKEIEAGAKWSILASWKEADRYKVSYQPTTAGAASITLDRPRSHDLSIKAQYTRNATWQRLNIEGIETFPVLHITAEVIDVSDDSDRQNRRVLTVTYDVPVRKGVSFPVSLVYANKPEFLGDPDHQFSAHFGMSLNTLFGNQGN